VGTQLNWDQYATAWARLHGGFDPRAAAPPVRAWLRLAYHVGYVLGRLRVTPTTVTVVGVLLCFGVPLVATRPQDGPFLGALLVLLASVADFCHKIFALAFAEGGSKGSGQGLHGLKTNVVTGVAVAGFRIAQAYDQFHDGASEAGAKKRRPSSEGRPILRNVRD